MKKKKPKKSSPSKTSPKTSPAKSSFPPTKVPEKVPIFVVDNEVSDAQFDSTVEAVAQLPVSHPDPTSQSEVSPSAKSVIAVQSADPSSALDEELTNNRPESSSKGLPPSCSATLPEASKPSKGLDLSGATTNVAIADANVIHVSSQQANEKDLPSAREHGEIFTGGQTSQDIGSAPPKDTWCDLAKGVKRLSKKGEAFTLPSGEACIKIPNSVIEKNRKSWEPFVLGQFYSDPPSQGTLHNIVNGIWSKQYRDIAVSKMEGFAFLFRIPNAATRARVIKQKLWQIEGQTMFVDKWEPGVVPTKPELTSAPIWLELRKVPLQFFNEDGLERIAGLVGHPKFLHPTTANKTNLEVAKVFTIIDPRKPVPKAVNVQFDSGEICRVLVSSPWMPPVCDICKEIGHAARRCPRAPTACTLCGSTDHDNHERQESKGKKTRRGRSKDKLNWVLVNPPNDAHVPSKEHPAEQSSPVVPPQPNQTVTPMLEFPHQTKLGTGKDIPDSSDVESSDSELEEGEFSRFEPDFEMITVEITWPSSQSNLIISVIYASNDIDERTNLWAEISSLASSQALDSKPWMILGDFNQIREPAEHSKPQSLNLDKKMRDFNQCLLNANVEDLNFRGTSFTWWNKQKNSPIAKNLDRCLVNDDWYFNFPSSVAFFGSPEFSDHATAGFRDLVCVNWFSFNITGSAMYRVSKKLKLLKKCIKDFSRLNYSGIERKTAEAHEKLIQAQAVMLSSPLTMNASAELQALKEWEDLYAATRQAINHIHFLNSDVGERIESQEGIQQLCVDYFLKLLGSESSQPMFIQSDLDLLFNFRCSEEQIAGFEKKFTNEDIKEAFFSLPRNKTGGPDGYSAEFFIDTWEIIGPEVTEAILEFFNSGCLLKQWNSASLALIPKIPNASHPSEFRPISCLNTVYKVISKLLASRLKEILPLMISKSQSAFLPGRLLAENVLLATDLVNGYNTQNISPRGMLKVDLRKAFDCLRWDFILASLRALAIPESYIRLISECLSTASFSISINGALGGFFNSTKGIRQGDPMSPYLFVLLAARFDTGNIGYHPRTENVKISHLMFADDVMIFFDGNNNSLHGIAECLDDFASWSACP
ncbi:uncharacterized protein LOC106393218 [Brassica napus]|uniref:uncharacterized protein LOC106393218 n=1 Tax=Brassica napus TaxID=3708 RepID=UPI00207AEA7C|nr:uncharacterized protein LOC106393218 [Brassica napus]